MQNKPAIAVEGVSFRFADETKRAPLTLKDISFSVAHSEFVSIVGPSGCGKSTLLRLILDLQKPTSGSVEKNFTKSAMVFQGVATFPWLTVYENVAFGLRMQGMRDDTIASIVREKINEVGLRQNEGKHPRELSGGMRQRVGVARALAVSPDFLVMDEPFSSLDSITATALKNDILALWEKYRMTVLLVSHLISEAIELSDRIIVMGKHPGMIKKVIPIELPRPRNPRSSEFFKLLDEITALIDA